MSLFEGAFAIGAMVFLRLRPERKPGLVTAVTFRPSGALYGVSWDDGRETGHYDFELSREFEPDYGQD